MPTRLVVSLAMSLLAVVSAGAAASSSESSTGQTYALEYRFAPGETIRSEVVHRASVNITITGNNQQTETRSGSVKTWKILDASDAGPIRFVHSVESIDMWQKRQGRQEISYNSRTDEQPPTEYEDAAKAVGVPLTVFTMDRRGKVLEREDQRGQGAANPMPITLQLPEKPVAIGDSWQVQQTVDVTLQPAGIKRVDTRQKFTLRAVAGNLATIELDPQILTPVDDPKIQAQLIQRMGKGTIEFDLARGRVVREQLDVDQRILGINGQGSMMHYVARYTEQLLPDEPETAQR